MGAARQEAWHLFSKRHALKLRIVAKETTYGSLPLHGNTSHWFISNGSDVMAIHTRRRLLTLGTIRRGLSEVQMDDHCLELVFRFAKVKCCCVR